MSFAEFAARIAPLARPRLARSLRRSMGSKRRKTKSGFRLGEHFVYIHGNGHRRTVRSIRNWPNWDGSPSYWLYATDGGTYPAAECEHVEL